MTYTFTVESVYGKPFEQLTPPAGYEFTGGFRPARDGEIGFIPSSLSSPSLSPGFPQCGFTTLPVLILRPIKRRRIIFEERKGLKSGEYYNPTPDEWLQWRGNPSLMPCGMTKTIIGPATIFTRREEEF